MNLSQIYQSISKKEWRFVVLMTILIIIITTLPIFYSYIHEPEDKTLTGIHALTSIDMNVYYSYIEQTKQNNFVFNNLFTTEKQNIKIFNIFWLSVGLLGKIFNLDSIITFQIARVLLIPIFILTAYLFISYFFQSKTKRQVALLFILFSSGIGALLIPVLSFFVFDSYGYSHWPLDLWVPESITFLSLFHMPHFIASLILIVLIFFFTLLSWEEKKLKYEIYAGLLALILFQFHPFHLPTVFGVLGAYFAFLCFVNSKILWEKLRPLIILFLFTLPDLIYHFYTLQDPLIEQRALQNVCLTPAWWLTIIGFGFLVPLGIVGVYYVIKKETAYKKFNKYHFLICWLVVQTLLIYSPSPLQRRMTEGLHIVLSLLTVVAIFGIIHQIRKKTNFNKLEKLIIYADKNRMLLLILFIFFFTFSNFFNITRDFLLYNLSESDPSFQKIYMTKQDKEAFEWIKKNTEKNSAFLAHSFNNNLIPGHTGRFSFAGHTTETYFYHAKATEIDKFFTKNNTDEVNKNFLKNNNINYIYIGPVEKSIYDLEKGLKPEMRDYLKLVYDNGLVRIYKVGLW